MFPLKLFPTVISHPPESTRNMPLSMTDLLITVLQPKGLNRNSSDFLQQYARDNSKNKKPLSIPLTYFDCTVVQGCCFAAKRTQSVSPGLSVWSLLAFCVCMCEYTYVYIISLKHSTSLCVWYDVLQQKQCRLS